jgi:hypothetical protein
MLSTDTAYALVGLGMSAGGALLAFTRRRGSRSYYATDVYRMTQRSHARFAALSAAFGAGFVAALRWPALDVPLLAVYTLALVLYISSFARGFTGEDE